MKNLFKKKVPLVLIIAVLAAGGLPGVMANAQSAHTYYVHHNSKLYVSSKSSDFKRYIPINAKLSTTSKPSSKRYKITYNGQTGYVYRSNLAKHRTTVTRYIHKTSYLYTSRDASKTRLQKIAINKSLTTDSNLNSTMYHVNYKGKRGYVYKVNLSTRKTPITKIVMKSSKIYKDYSHTKKYTTKIPVQTQVTTTSPQSNKMFWVSYRGIHGYVYASNLKNPGYLMSVAYDNALAADTYGVVTGGGNHGIWDKPYGEQGARSIGRIANYEYMPLTQLREAKVGSTVWVQVAAADKILGWVHKESVQTTSGANDAGERPKLAVASVANPNGAVYASPVSGGGDSLSIYANLKLKIDEMTSDGVWAHVKKYTAGTTIGWVHASDLTIQPYDFGHSLNVNYNPSWVNGSAAIFDDQLHFVGYVNQYVRDTQSVQITREAQAENEEMYQLTDHGHTLGWTYSTAVTIWSKTSPDGYMWATRAGIAVFNGTADGDSADTSQQVGTIDDLGLTNRMLEVVKQASGYAFIKYNDWYDKTGKDIDIGWVKSDQLLPLVDRTKTFTHLFNASGGSQQGLTYDQDDDVYYVGYDDGNGKGHIIKYSKQNNYKASQTISGNFGHDCALSYADGYLYEISSAGTQPVLYKINTATGQFVNPITGAADPQKQGYTLKNFPRLANGKSPYIAMMTAKNDGTLVLLTESFGDDTFFTLNLKNMKINNLAQLKKMGIVQGMQYDNETQQLYFLANNYLTVLDNQMQIVDRFRFSIPDGDNPQESEGLTIANGKLTIGFNGHSIYQQ
ncbi:MAG: GW dipeptide domain-containing protein [Sporolactobacillus sp.]